MTPFPGNWAGVRCRFDGGAEAGQRCRDVWCSGAFVADHADSIGAGEGTGRALAQWTGREHTAIAKAVTAINHQKADGFGQGRVLKAVIHDQNSGTGSRGCLRRCRAVAANPGRGMPGQDQGLVPNHLDFVMACINTQWATYGAAIPSGEDMRVPVGKPLHEIDADLRFAGTADYRIADTDDRNESPPQRFLMGSPLSDCAICAAERRQQVAQQRSDQPVLTMRPEIRCAHGRVLQRYQAAVKCGP